jgi:chromosomal replication initiator protein
MNADMVIGATAEEYNLDTAALVGRSRITEVAEARQSVMYVLWRHNDLTLTEIGSFLGGRSAATVSHGFQRIARRLPIDSRLRNRVEDIVSKVEGRGN